jgi:hypothetical protein
MRSMQVTKCRHKWCCSEARGGCSDGKRAALRLVGQGLSGHCKTGGAGRLEDGEDRGRETVRLLVWAETQAEAQAGTQAGAVLLMMLLTVLPC